MEIIYLHMMTIVIIIFVGAVDVAFWYCVADVVRVMSFTHGIYTKNLKAVRAKTD